MKIPRFLAVFLCSAAALLALAVLKAVLVSGLHTLPAAKILIFASASFGLVAAAIDWALLRDIHPIRSSRRSQIPEEDPAALPRIESAERLAQFMSHVADESVTPAPAPANPPDVLIIERVRMQPIVFQEICPPSAGGLSFYGGIPVAPAGFAWPRARNKPGKIPLSFVMQWDCSELAAQDAAGLLPRDGALYLFCDLTWGEPFDFQFVHAPGPTSEWQALQIPDDLPPVYGEEGVHLVPYCSSRVEKRMQDVPRLLPKWPFAPIAFSYPYSGSDADTDHRFWNGGDAVAEALLAVQDPEGLPSDLSTKTLPFDRPFPAFPHDCAAIRIVAAELLQRLHYPDPSLLRDRFEHNRKTTLQRWADGAAELYTSATSRPPASALEQSASDKLWRRMEEMKPVLERGWNKLVQECVNTSLGIGSDASAKLPREWVDICGQNHKLASVYRADHQQGPPAAGTHAPLSQVRSVHASTPDHMFGPPSYVQGHVEEYLDDWVLLLELSSRKQIGHEFGEGVYQFMIRPAHLRERQFGHVKLVAGAY